MEQLRAELTKMKIQMGHFMVDMQAMSQDQKLLREEVHQLKTQVSLVMEVLKTVLRKEDNPLPDAATEVVTSSLGSSSGYMPLVPESSCQPPMSVSRPSLKRKVFGKIVHSNQCQQKN